MEIRNRALIKSIDVNRDGTVVTIANAKLSEILTFLPAGIVYKDSTGMGATTLELRSDRNSIVVEPLKVTASQKAYLENAIYVGSPTTLHPMKITHEEIRSKLSASNGFIKFVVVADSLERLMKSLGDSFVDFFLLIDESDSFQLDSTYRTKMPLCFDIYHSHPKHMRAVLTATPIGFSDPRIESEARTAIRYERPSTNSISITHGENINGIVVDTVLKVIAQNPDDKVAIAFNSVVGCLDITKELQKNTRFDTISIAILCSKVNEEKVGNAFSELKEDRLPATINFLTSAYYTGFDINEPFHLICVSDIEVTTSILSENRIKQIAGRCRPGLLSCAVIYSTSTVAQTKRVTREDMIQAARIEITALECLANNYEKDPLLRENLMRIRGYIVSNTAGNGAQFVRMDIQNKYATNYLSIDAAIDAERVRHELYQRPEQLQHALEKLGYSVFFDLAYSSTKIIRERPQYDKSGIIDDTLSRIIGEPQTMLDNILYSGSLPKLQFQIMETYRQLRNHIKEDDIIRILRMLNARDSRGFMNIKFSALFVILDENWQYKREVVRRFKVDSVFTREELVKEWNAVFAETNQSYSFSTETQAVRWSKLHFKLHKSRAPVAFKIKDYNPEKFVVLQRAAGADSYNSLLTDLL